MFCTRFGMKTGMIVLTAVVAVATLLLWLLDDGYRQVYSAALSPRYKLTIRSRPLPESAELDLQITYHYPPAIGMFAVASRRIPMPAASLRFSKIIDQSTGIVCVYDLNNAGLLFFYSPSDNDFWQTGDHSGWAGTSPTEWTRVLQDLRTRHPSIPYTELPALGPG